MAGISIYNYIVWFEKKLVFQNT